MSYQVLARKWRPRSFQEMVGQEQILRMLSNALEQKRIHHAYLFTGTRGVGKTSLARLLAKCLNCEKDVTATPCNQCATCLAINAGQFLDLFEVDAASRTKVEDTRELLDNVLYPPTTGRYKIYLIDEVHMLSNHSFNALLKTLEEPPPHVVFLLATTDPKRLPITILSRCLQFHLKRILPQQIAAHLQHICQTEQIEHDMLALNKLSKAADGSMRDALSLLDQAIAYGHGKVTTDDVNHMLGSMPQENLLPLLDALALQDGKQLFAIVQTLAEHAPDFQQLLEELISLFHQLALAQIVPSTLPDDHAALPFVSRFTAETLQLYYQIALLGRRDLALAPTPQQGFEMTMLRMLAFQPETETQQNKTQSSKINHPPIDTHTIKPATVKNDNVVASQTPAVIQNISSPLAAENTPETYNWRDILSQLNLTGMAQALAANCVLTKIENNRVQLTLNAQHEALLNTKSKERIAEALNKFFNRTIDLTIHLTKTTIETPLKQVQTEKESLLQEAKQTILSNTQIKHFIDQYDATLEVALIKE